MKIHHLTVDEALHSLRSGPDGLAESEVRRRLGEFGLNRVEQLRRESLVLRFLKGFAHFFALILWVAAGLAFIAEFSEPGKGMGMLGFAILGVILLNGLFSFWQEYRAEKAIAALERLLPHQVKVLREGKVLAIPAQDVVPGDVILLEEGDDIPADCRLIEAFGVRVNNATVTGESLPQARDVNPSSEEELIRGKNILLAGTSLVSGEARALVFATAMHTEFGKIAHLTQTTGEMLSPLQKEIIRLSRLVALLASGLGVVFFFIGQALGLSFWENFIFAIGIIVANVPEGLLPTVTLALAVDLGTDMLPALGLGTEKPDPRIMQRPPRPRGERLLSGSLMLRAYLFLGGMEAVAAMAAFFYVLHGAGWQYGQMLPHDDPLYLQATTACLSAIIVMQVVNVFLCRSDRDSVLSRGFFNNKLIMWGIAAEIVLILLIDYTSWGNQVFGTAPISIDVWLFVVPFALGMLVLEELRKWAARKFF